VDAVKRVRRANPAALWACDPVLGDSDTGLYVDADLPPVLAGALDMADILTPNAFELGLLTGRTVENRNDALAACHDLRARLRKEGPRLVVCTSLPGGGDLTILMLCDRGAYEVTVPRIDGAPRGAGDLLAALLLGRYLQSGDAIEALRLAVSGVHAGLALSAAAKADELQIVTAQDEIIAPGQIFDVSALDVKEV
jgi:pyridoxine kinase